MLDREYEIGEVYNFFLYTPTIWVWNETAEKNNVLKIFYSVGIRKVVS